MKVKLILICFFSIALLVSCKSKKKATQKSVIIEDKKVEQTKEELIIEPVVEVKTPITTSTEAYIKKYAAISMEEMKKYKIPASITLAQGILESSSGKSELTLRSNNHFGIKCHKGWTGKKTYHDDDEKGECFRVYKDPRNSYKDHSEFLTSRSRYASLFELDQEDYEGWAKGLSTAGYATDRRYPAKLVGIIEKYDLSKYDEQVLGKSYKKKKKKRKVSHLVSKGDTLYSISRKYGLTVNELKKINGLDSNNINVGQSLIVKK